MQTGRERTLRAIEFNGPDRIPLCLSIERDHKLDAEYSQIIGEKFDTDIIIIGNSDPDLQRGPEEPDEWGCIWSSMGHTMGEVMNHPLEDWDNYDAWAASLYDWSNPRRYEEARAMREANPDKFIVGSLGLMMEIIINLRGFQEYMIDLYLERENLDKLIDLLYAKAIQAIDCYADAGLDAIIAFEDWGLQDRPMMKCDMWREIFKDRMAAMVKHIHDRGMKYILHSCGYIVDLIDDFVDIGIDVLQLDQQRNMGLDLLKERCSGRICLDCPPDIQLSSGNNDAIAMEKYYREMVEHLASPEGGFIYKCYPQPEAINMPLEALIREIEFFRDVRPGK